MYLLGCVAVAKYNGFRGTQVMIGPATAQRPPGDLVRPMVVDRVQLFPTRLQVEAIALAGLYFIVHIRTTCPYIHHL